MSTNGCDLNCWALRVVTSESGRGRPHSKTLARFSGARRAAEGFGVRLPSAAFVRRRSCPTFLITPFKNTMVALAAVCWVSAALADDWPQWLGPNRDGVWREAGIMDHFPTNGLPVQWR